MSFKLTKVEQTRLVEFSQDLDTRHEDIVKSIETYNAVLQEARDFCEDISGRWQGDYDDKTDGWRDGDKGTAVAELISSWDEVIGTMDPIDTPTNDVADALTALETEPGS